GMSSLLTQNDACGFGAIDARITAAATHFVSRRAVDVANRIAIITPKIRNAYIMERTGRAIEITGNRPTIAHGIGNPGRPATRSAGPNEATIVSASIAIRNLPADVRHVARRYVSIAMSSGIPM